MSNKDTILKLKKLFTRIVAETNGISLNHTLELLLSSHHVTKDPKAKKIIIEFQSLLTSYQQGNLKIQALLAHPMSHAIFDFLFDFPLKYHEDHIHLTGSLESDFIYKYLEPILNTEASKDLETKVNQIYGVSLNSITSPEIVNKLIRLREEDRFEQYLKILFIPTLILRSKDLYEKAAYSMAKNLYNKYNVGSIRLKFTYSRITSKASEQIPGVDRITSEDAVLGLYHGFLKFKNEFPDFNFNLSPCFRKEAYFYDSQKFKSKGEHIESQVQSILKLLENHPELAPHLNEVDTVGSEYDLYRKEHFNEMKDAFQRLHSYGFSIRSHHGEVWTTLKRGIQAVDNAMNIWHIDNIEHGLSLGINPNYYFQSLFQRLLEANESKKPIAQNTREYLEVLEMDWRNDETGTRDKLLQGIPLSTAEIIIFTKVKFRTAIDIERYQHDILNRMLQKQISLVALPSSNIKLTSSVKDYKDHPFSWWEKKGIHLGVGTDNYVTLNTNFINEMLILLYSNPEDIKITKLLMIATKETRRPYLSRLLWRMLQNQE